MQTVEQKETLFKELDKRIAMSTDYFNAKLKAVMSLRADTEQVKYRVVLELPTHFTKQSMIHEHVNVWPGDANNINTTGISDLLINLVDGVVSEIFLIQDRDKSIPWDLLYFNIGRSNDGGRFKASSRLYVQTTRNVIEEAIETLEKSKSCSPGIVYAFMQECFMKRLSELSHSSNTEKRLTEWDKKNAEAILLARYNASSGESRPSIETFVCQ